MRPPRVGDDLPDDCKLYVGNIGQDITEDQLRAAFEPHGTVLHTVIPKARPLSRAVMKTADAWLATARTSRGIFLW